MISIEQLWLLLRQRPDPADVLDQVAESLEALRAELAHHFAEEEAGGCLEEAVAHQPSLSHEVTRLEREHPEILRQMDRLLQRLSELSHIDKSVREIEGDFRGLASKLQDHEAAENRILEESFGIQAE